MCSSHWVQVTSQIMKQWPLDLRVIVHSCCNWTCRKCWVFQVKWMSWVMSYFEKQVKHFFAQRSSLSKTLSFTTTHPRTYLPSSFHASCLATCLLPDHSWGLLHNVEVVKKTKQEHTHTRACVTQDRNLSHFESRLLFQVIGPDSQVKPGDNDVHDSSQLGWWKQRFCATQVNVSWVPILAKAN